MIRLHALVEGQTEEAYFNRVLVPHLSAFGIFADVRVLNPKSSLFSRRYKGGWNSYHAAKRDLVNWMAEDTTAWFTTMVDLYALPEDFPRYHEFNQHQDAYIRVKLLETAWKEDICTDAFWRFVPYIQLHEFETLILADPQKLDWEFLEHDPAIQNLINMVSGQNPELINDGRDTAPSKRIVRHIPEYEGRKASSGPLVADKIGLGQLRMACQHFDSWIAKLENLSE